MAIRWLVLLLLPFALTVHAGDCKYPKKPINWILRYCAMVSETDDEVVIQDSECFKEAKKDLDSTDTCGVKEKYKRKICEQFMMEIGKYQSVNDCLLHDKTAPYVSG